MPTGPTATPTGALSSLLASAVTTPDAPTPASDRRLKFPRDEVGFYAELQKLRRVVDGIKSERPLFFLLDEILQGTNSRERVIGARSVLRHLLEHGAMGAVSTHDVGLLDLPPELDAKLDKVHFQEQVHEDKTGTSDKIGQVCSG